MKCCDFTLPDGTTSSDVLDDSVKVPGIIKKHSDEFIIYDDIAGAEPQQRQRSMLQYVLITVYRQIINM